MNAAIMSGLGVLSNTAKQIASKKDQAEYRAGAQVGDPFFKPGTPSQTFNKSSCDAGNNIFGSQEQRDVSMPNRGNIEGPLAMEDLSGDGKITQKDVGIGQGGIKPDDK